MALDQLHLDLKYDLISWFALAKTVRALLTTPELLAHFLLVLRPDPVHRPIWPLLKLLIMLLHLLCFLGRRCMLQNDWSRILIPLLLDTTSYLGLLGVICVEPCRLKRKGAKLRGKQAAE